MSELPNIIATNGRNEKHQVGSMKIFASWEVDNNSPNCIPRLCMLTAISLEIIDLSDVEDCKDVVLSVQMQGGRNRNRRVLRSGAIQLSSQCEETELDITFSLQYAHFMKRDGNCLRISLQKRNKSNYKKFLGFKTIAMGLIDLTQVLQKSMDLRLDMYSTDSKHRNKLVATVSLQHITSKPVHNLSTTSGAKHHHTSGSGQDRSGDSDEDEEDEDEVYVGGESPSDDDQIISTQSGFSGNPTSASEQRNFKQKFVQLLRRFKSSDDAEENFNSIRVQKHILNALERKSSRRRRSHHRSNDVEYDCDEVMDSVNLDELFDELDNLSDDDREHDNISIQSTPKPQLPVYFTEASSIEELVEVTESLNANSPSRSANSNGMSAHGANTSPRHNSLSLQIEMKHQGMPSRERSHSLTDQSAIGVVSQNTSDFVQIDRIYRESETQLPEFVYLCDSRPDSYYSNLSTLIYQNLYKSQSTAIRITSESDINHLMVKTGNAIEQFCNNNSRSPSPIKLVLIGSNGFFSMVLSAYVKVFSQKPADWMHYVRSILVPLGASSVYRRLCQSHLTLTQSFGCDTPWTSLIDKLEQKGVLTKGNSGDCGELVDTLRQVLSTCQGFVQQPICEALITYKTNNQMTAVQQFVPFITEVLIGTLPSSIPESFDEGFQFKTSLSTSPPVSSSPPSNNPTSPSPAQLGASATITTAPAGLALSEPCELQLDFWVPVKDKDSKHRPPSKETLKGYFKYILVYRERNYFILEAQIKDKKNKMIRIGKRPKGGKELGKQNSDAKGSKIVRHSISRIVCTTKDDSQRLNVLIDQVEYTGVHFFQLSTQWQSHVKNMPIAAGKLGHLE